MARRVGGRRRRQLRPARSTYKRALGIRRCARRPAQIRVPRRLPGTGPPRASESSRPARPAASHPSRSYPRELADSMGHPPTVLRRASARLVARGLLRRRRRRSRHHRLEVTLATTASGMGALWRAAQALGIDPSASPTPPVAPDWPATSSKAIGDTTGRPAAAAPPRIDTGARTG
jgi:hypothetical protein